MKFLGRMGRLLLVGYGALMVLVNGSAAQAEPIRPQGAETVRILALGDSLTAGFGLPAEASFPAQLEKALRAEGLDVTVINAGVSGDTSAGGLARLDWALADKPDVAIVELGANDGLRGLDPKRLEANLDAILTKLKGQNVRILLTGMRAPPNFGAEYAETFAQVYPALARKHGVPLYPFFLDGVARQAGLNLTDGLHPNAEGVKVIVARILPQVRELLNGKGGKG